MSQKIGRQDGIDWIVSILRKIPGVKYRPLGDRPLSLEQWYGLEKYERLLRILKDDHDAALSSPLPEPPGPITPDPPTKRYAPRAYNLGGRNQDPRFCCRPEYGVQVITHPEYGPCYRDEMGCHYDLDKMLNLDGQRDRARMVPGIAGADSMDQRETCDPYVHEGNSHPPYPKESYLK